MTILKWGFILPLYMKVSYSLIWCTQNKLLNQKIRQWINAEEEIKDNRQEVVRNRNAREERKETR